jgi:hypothetical protein
MTVENLIKNLNDGDNVSASKEFEGIMADKMTAALDAKKVEIASTLVQRKAEEPEEE